MGLRELLDAIRALALAIRKRSSSPTIDQWTVDLEGHCDTIAALPPAYLERRSGSDRRRNGVDAVSTMRRMGQRRGVAVIPEPATPAVSWVTITSATPPDLGSGDTWQLTVLVETEEKEVSGVGIVRVHLTGRTVTYASDNEAVVTVSASGLVSYAGAGSATVTATCEGVSASQSFTASAPQAAVASVTVTPATLTIASGTTVLSAVVRDAGGSVLAGQTVTWVSSAPAVATIGADSGDENHQATLTVVADGSTTITATSSAVNGTSAVTVSSAVTVGEAVLPLATPTYTYTPPTGGTLHTPADGTALAAILAAPNTTLQLGDIIELTAGVDYTATVNQFTFPNVTTQRGGTSAAVIYVRTANMGSLPAAGVRVNSGHKAQMPLFAQKFGGAGYPIGFAQKAHDYVFAGIAVTAGTVTVTSSLIRVGLGSYAPADYVHDITFDRCYMAAEAASNNCGRPLYLFGSGANIVIVECHIYNEAASQVESQAILIGRNNSGPMLIQNNYLAAAAENIMFGGDGPGPDATVIPADVTIRRNHFYKDPAWSTGVAPPSKNLFEMKCGLRVLFEDNYCENFWQNGQSHAINLKSVNQTGSDNLVETRDVVIRYCRWKNIVGWFKASPGQNESGGSYVAASQITVQHNLAEGLQYYGTSGGGFFSADVDDVHVLNNTVMCDGVGSGTNWYPGNASGPSSGLVVRDNIFQHMTYGIKGDSLGSGNASIAACYPGSVWAGNGMIAFPSASNPAGNTYPASIAAAGFTDSATRDYSLSAGSVLKTTGYAGGDPGCDVATVLSRTSGCTTGSW